jgi:hypothetical protein
MRYRESVIDNFQLFRPKRKEVTAHGHEIGPDAVRSDERIAVKELHIPAKRGGRERDPAPFSGCRLRETI